MSPFDPTADRRGAPRYPVDRASAVRVNGHFVPCRLVELSQLGARVAADTQPDVGQHVTLELPDQEFVIAKVVRVTADYFALAFPGAIVISALVKDDAV